MTEQTSNDLVEQAKWIAKAANSLDTLINERSDAKAEAALAKAYLEADERLKTVRTGMGAQLRRQEDLIEELRRQLVRCDQIIARHGELAEALGVPAYTPWELLIAKVRAQAPERGDTQRTPDQTTNPLNAQDGAPRG